MAKLTRNPCGTCQEDTIHNGLTCTRCGVTRPATVPWGASKQFVMPRRSAVKPYGHGNHRRRAGKNPILK